eukprot:s1381_g6.t1
MGTTMEQRSGECRAVAMPTALVQELYLALVHTVSLSPVSFTLRSESDNAEVLEHPFYEQLHTLAKPC